MPFAENLTELYTVEEQPLLTSNIYMTRSILLSLHELIVTAAYGEVISTYFPNKLSTVLVNTNTKETV